MLMFLNVQCFRSISYAVLTSCGLAKDHGSLVTLQNFLSWALVLFEQRKKLWCESWRKTFVILTSIKVFLNSVRLALYFILVLGMYDSTVLKYLAWRTELPKRAVTLIHGVQTQILLCFPIERYVWSISFSRLETRKCSHKPKLWPFFGAKSNRFWYGAFLF